MAGEGRREGREEEGNRVVYRTVAESGRSDHLSLAKE